MRGGYPVRVPPPPDFHILTIEILPNFFILMFHGTDLIPHDNNLIILANIPLRYFPMIQMHLAIHFQILVLASYNVLVEFMSLDGYGWVVVEEQVKQGYVLGVAVVFQTQGLLPDLEHEITIEPEKNLRWCVLARLLDLIRYILYLYINVLQTPFSL